MKILKKNIRRAELKDLKNYFLLVNEPLVRQNSINKNPISLADHSTWFERRIKSNSTYMFVLEINSTFAGQVRFDVEEDSLLIDYSLAADYRGYGLGRFLIEKGMHLLNEKRENNTFIAQVLEENVPSIKVFEKIGFTKIDQITLENRVFYKYMYNEKD